MISFHDFADLMILRLDLDLDLIFARQLRRLFEGGAYLKIVPDKFTFSIYLFNGTVSIC